MPMNYDIPPEAGHTEDEPDYEMFLPHNGDVYEDSGKKVFWTVELDPDQYSNQSQEEKEVARNQLQASGCLEIATMDADGSPMLVAKWEEKE